MRDVFTGHNFFDFFLSYRFLTSMISSHMRKFTIEAGGTSGFNDEAIDDEMFRATEPPQSLYLVSLRQLFWV
jgi:hypothetical protein